MGLIDKSFFCYFILRVVMYMLKIMMVCTKAENPVNRTRATTTPQSAPFFLFYSSLRRAAMLRAASPHTALTTAGGSQPMGLICAM